MTQRLASTRGGTVATLTARQQQVAELVAQGRTNPDIAAALTAGGR